MMKSKKKWKTIIHPKWILSLLLSLFLLSTQVYARTPYVAPPPNGAPENLRATGTTPTTINLAWNAVTGHGYGTMVYLVHLQHTDTSGTTHGRDVEVVGESCSLPGLEPSTDYTITVKALGRYITRGRQDPPGPLSRPLSVRTPVLTTLPATVEFRSVISGQQYFESADESKIETEVILSRALRTPIRLWVTPSHDIQNENIRRSYTKTDGNDLMRTRIPVDIPAGVTSHTLSIPLIDDNINENVMETIQLNLSVDPLSKGVVEKGRKDISYVYIPGEGIGFEALRSSAEPVVEGGFFNFTLRVISKRGDGINKTPVHAKAIHPGGRITYHTFQLPQSMDINDTASFRIPVFGEVTTGDQGTITINFPSSDDYDYPNTSFLSAPVIKATVNTDTGPVTKPVLRFREGEATISEGETLDAFAIAVVELSNRDTNWPAHSPGSLEFSITSTADTAEASDHDFRAMDKTFSATGTDVSAFVVSATDDDLSEGTESFYLELSVPDEMKDRVVLGTPSRMKITIADNDELPTLSISSIWPSAGEGKRVSFKITATSRTRPNLPNSVNSSGGQLTTFNYYSQTPWIDQILPRYDVKWSAWSGSPNEEGLYTATTNPIHFWSSPNLSFDKDLFQIALKPGRGYAVIDGEGAEASVNLIQGTRPECGFASASYTIDENDTTISAALVFSRPVPQKTTVYVRVEEYRVNSVGHDEFVRYASTPVLVTPKNGRRISFTAAIPAGFGNENDPTIKKRLRIYYSRLAQGGLYKSQDTPLYPREKKTALVIVQ